VIIYVTRKWLDPTAVLGSLTTDVGFSCFTLERRLDAATHPGIPAGDYPLTLEPTHNVRLWSPDPDRFLPRLHDVPGREGILIHAGNVAGDTEGCILVGLERATTPGVLLRSRDALRSLVAILRQADLPGRVIVIDLTQVG
jgi:hypothetical protein